MFKKIAVTWIGICLLVLGLNAIAASDDWPTWPEFVKQVRSEAIADGIRPELFDEIFKNIKAPSPKVIAYDRNQPEKRLTFLKYRNTRADAFRIKLGRRELRKYKPLLNEISNHYGVSPCFIVSFWGLETSYGRFMGKFPVINSLATLAYDKRRSKFFRKQLIYALHIVNDGHIDLKNFKGEWAGASGHPQFLPSSWHRFAVDYDKDGRKDIWTTYSDVFASIANYVVQNGWKKGEPWAIEVKAPDAIKDLVNAKKQKTVNEWRELDVKTLDNRPWPNGNLKADLIRPYGGPDLLVFNNFRVIMKWNRSTYYAGTVGYMAEKICGRSL